jgi:MtN3 and saliva related transmembrane protein
MDLDTIVGSASAICTSISNFPQLKKSWTTGETDDLSFKMLALLVTGLSLWTTYGLMRADGVIVVANGISAAMVGIIIWLKTRDHRGVN